MDKHDVLLKLHMCAWEPSSTLMVPMLVIDLKGFQSHVYVLHDESDSICCESLFMICS
jgi:hypothetical protein